MSNSNSKNNLAERGPIYLVDGEEASGEMERAIGISVMGVGGDGGGIFSLQFDESQQSGDYQEFKKQWSLWLHGLFRNQLSDVFVKVYLASAEMRMNRIAELDRELNRHLCDKQIEKSREAGRWFLEGKSEMKRAPQWQKYARYVEQEDCPGHVVTTFALQAALYHLPLLSALTSYVYFEWRAGMLAFGEKGDLARVELSKFHKEYPESVEVVREVFARDFQLGRFISGL